MAYSSGLKEFIFSYLMHRERPSMLSTENEAIKCNNTNDKLTALDKKVNSNKIIYFLSFYYIVI